MPPSRGFPSLKDGAETFVLARVCFSQDRVAVPLSSVKKHKHPLFA